MKRFLPLFFIAALLSGCELSFYGTGSPLYGELDSGITAEGTKWFISAERLTIAETSGTLLTYTERSQTREYRFTLFIGRRYGISSYSLALTLSNRFYNPFPCSTLRIDMSPGGEILSPWVQVQSRIEGGYYIRTLEGPITADAMHRMRSSFSLRVSTDCMGLTDTVLTIPLSFLSYIGRYM